MLLTMLPRRDVARVIFGKRRNSGRVPDGGAAYPSRCGGTFLGPESRGRTKKGQGQKQSQKPYLPILSDRKKHHG